MQLRKLDLSIQGFAGKLRLACNLQPFKIMLQRSAQLARLAACMALMALLLGSAPAGAEEPQPARLVRQRDHAGNAVSVVARKPEDVERVVRIAREAERRGIERIFVGYAAGKAGSPSDLSSTLTMQTIKAILEQTRTIKVGPGIMPAVHSAREIAHEFVPLAKQHGAERLLLYMAPGDSKVLSNARVASPLKRVRNTLTTLSQKPALREAEFGVGVTWGKKMQQLAKELGKAGVISGVLINSVDLKTAQPVMQELKADVKKLWLIGPGLVPTEQKKIDAYYGAAFPAAALSEEQSAQLGVSPALVTRIRGAVSQGKLQDLVDNDQEAKRFLARFMLQEGRGRSLATQILRINRAGAGVVLSHPFASSLPRAVRHLDGRKRPSPMRPLLPYHSQGHGFWPTRLAPQGRR